MRWRRLTASALLLLTLGCDGDPSAGDGSSDEAREEALVALGERDDWRPLEADADPFAEHRPEGVDCPSAAWQPEGGALEIQTGVCNYFARVQPSRIDLDEGDRVIVDLWHDALDAAAPTTGHVAVLIDDTVIGEAMVVIPTQASALRFEWTVDRPLPAGAEVYLHLHNHGFNSWSFVAVRAVVRG
ncbi:MAG: hypothetical protein R3A79_25120 [Nannocystaceae bacterium]